MLNKAATATYTLTVSYTTYTISYTKDSSVPSGYTELEYIESTGTQYIDTGYKPTSENLKFYLEFMQTTSASGQSLFGSEDNKTAAYAAVFN